MTRRVLSLYLVALGVAYPIGSLIQGPRRGLTRPGLDDRRGECSPGGPFAVYAVLRPEIISALAAPASAETRPARGTG